MTTREHARALRELTPTQAAALEAVRFSAEPVWWHDVGAGAHTASALLRRGLIREARRVSCSCREPHPGYVEAVTD